MKRHLIQRAAISRQKLKNLRVWICFKIADAPFSSCIDRIVHVQLLRLNSLIVNSLELEKVSFWVIFSLQRFKNAFKLRSSRIGFWTSNSWLPTKANSHRRLTWKATVKRLIKTSRWLSSISSQSGVWKTGNEKSHFKRCPVLANWVSPMGKRSSTFACEEISFSF